MTASPDLRVVVPALGITQILAWGSTFYLLGALAPLIARDTGWTYDLILSGVSVGLLVAGLAAPRVGHFIARKGGRPVLAIGSFLLASGLLGVGLSPNFASYLLAWVVIGLGMSAALYDAAFSTLGGIYGSQSRSAITSVTLFGGFASTVCWPLSAVLATHLGWRGACFAYAAIQTGIALPIHLLAVPSHNPAALMAAKSRPRVQLQRDEIFVFALVAAVVTNGASILSIMGTHLLPILTARGLGLTAAVGLGAIVGPSQVGARVMEMLVERRHHHDPLWTMVVSAVLVAVAASMLALNLPSVALAIALYGAGNGLGSIARGTMPLALFGPERYPVLMGRLALPLLLAMAVSPYLGALAFQQGGAEWTLGLLAAIALVNLVLVTILLLLTKRHR